SDDEERTEQHLLRQAELYLSAGAKALMPSGMLPGFPGKLRAWWQSSNFGNPCIISQSAKFDSPLYGPFRRSEGMELSVSKSSYQLAAHDTELALELLRRDTRSGADACLVKPALPYRDLLIRAAGELRETDKLGA